jgi:hypothetical protein
MWMLTKKYMSVILEVRASTVHEDWMYLLTSVGFQK